jgi:hypothetical protein
MRAQKGMIKSMALRHAKPVDKGGGCYWCGEWSDKITEDHVPPKLVFPKRVHPLLPRVPACDPCNKVWECEAEYFRDFLLSGALAKCEHRELVPIRQKFERAQAYREKLTGRRSIFSPTPQGVTVQGIGDGLGPPKRFALNEINMRRIGDVVSRTISALHVHFMVPLVRRGELENIPILVPEGYAMVTSDVTGELYGKAIDIMEEHGRNEWADGLLQWFVCVAGESPQYEFLLSFYRTAVFYARIHPIGATELVSPLFDNHPFKLNPPDALPKRNILWPEAATVADAVHMALHFPRKTK